MSCKGFNYPYMVDASSDKNGRLHLCGCKDSKNFWNAQIYLWFFAKLACFEQVLQSRFSKRKNQGL
jgi:hypothetical protein